MRTTRSTMDDIFDLPTDSLDLPLTGGRDNGAAPNLNSAQLGNAKAGQVFQKLYDRLDYERAVKTYDKYCRCYLYLRTYAPRDGNIGLGQSELTQLKEDRVRLGADKDEAESLLRSFAKLAKSRTYDGRPGISLNDMHAETKHKFLNVIGQDLKQNLDNPHFSENTKRIFGHMVTFFDLSNQVAIERAQAEINELLPRGFFVELKHKTTSKETDEVQNTQNSENIIFITLVQGSGSIQFECDRACIRVSLT